MNIISAVTADNTIPYSLLESVFVLDFNKAETRLTADDEQVNKSDIISIDSVIESLKEYLNTNSHSFEEYINIMCCSNEEMIKEINEDSVEKSFLFMIVLLGRKIPLKFLAEKFNCDFWNLWERVKSFDTPAIFTKTSCENEELLPTGEVSTKEFLQVADEDRLYCWTPDGDVEISNETQEWLEALQQELQSISGSMETRETTIQFLRHMMRTLENMYQNFSNLFAFSDMFYEFIDHNDEIIYQASIQLLDRMIERQQEKCRTYEKKNGKDWDYRYYIQEQSKEIKRFLAVLSNTELRNRYLWAHCE